jgi:Mycothiol maleylpyruvate isomerase N-terminal domain
MSGQGASMQGDPRADLVQRAEAIRERWRRLAADVGAERMELPGPMGEWTFKDLASHLSAWRRRTIGRLEAAGRGVPPPPDPWPAELGEEEDDPINAWIHEQTRDLPLADVLAESEATYAALIAGIKALPMDEAARQRAAWVEAAEQDGHPWGHLGEHEPSVRAWLATDPR